MKRAGAAAQKQPFQFYYNPNECDSGEERLFCCSLA